MWAYSIVRHLLSVVVRQHFQTTSPRKSWSRFLPNFTYSIYGQGVQIMRKVKLVWFSFFVFHFSFFAFRFSLFVFRYSNWVGKFYFDIQNPILTFELSRKNVFWHSKSYFDIRTEAENPILIFKILFWHSNWVGKTYFDIQNPLLTFALSRKILFWYIKIGFSDSVRMIKIGFSDSVRMTK